MQADSLPSEPAIFCFYLYQHTSLLGIFSLFPEPSIGLRGRLNHAPKDIHLLILEPVNVLPSMGKGTLRTWLSIFILWDQSGSSGALSLITSLLFPFKSKEASQ